MKTQKIHNYLKAHGIKPLPYRVAIMQYLKTNHNTHPTSDQVYNDLLPYLPTLSKTTVYNTLKQFCDKKAAVALYIDEKNVRYDINLHVHAHFRCRKCGDIYEVPLKKEEIPQCKGSDYLRSEETQVYFLGICGKCEGF